MYDLVKHQSICATCVPYTGKTVGHNLDSGANEVRNDVIWRRAGASGIAEWSVCAASSLMGERS